MKSIGIGIISVFLMVPSYGQDPSDNIISRKTVDALPDEYPNGVYMMDSETDPDWSWPEDAGVVLGLKRNSTNSRHSQILIDRYGNKMMVRGKNWGNNEWTAWKRVLVENNGRIGIGTTSPVANLDVRTASESGILATLLSDAGISIASEVHRWTIRTGRSFDYPNRTLDFGMVSNSYGQNPAFYVAPKGVEVFRITENGEVGIGTTSPDSKLTVKGDIHAEEVKVDLSVPGPDYVFESDYKLRTLEETAAYIQTNKHLPEIPSAKEMEANGVQLGEMNMLLLKKIEELTLYIIEQEKKLKKQDELEQKIADLLNRIEKLEKK